MQQADGVQLRVIGAERVGADEFRQPLAHMRLGTVMRPHLVQHDGNARLGDLPGGFGTGKAAADDVDRVHVVSSRSAVFVVFGPSRQSALRLHAAEHERQVRSRSAGFARIYGRLVGSRETPHGPAHLSRPC